MCSCASPLDPSRPAQTLKHGLRSGIRPQTTHSKQWHLGHVAPSVRLAGVRPSPPAASCTSVATPTWQSTSHPTGRHPTATQPSATGRPQCGRPPAARCPSFVEHSACCPCGRPPAVRPFVAWPASSPATPDSFAWAPGRTSSRNEPELARLEGQKRDEHEEARSIPEGAFLCRQC